LTQFCHFQAINIKLVKVLYAVVLDGISNWNLDFTIEPLRVAVSVTYGLWGIRILCVYIWCLMLIQSIGADA
jgi:hypothetical protein